MSINLTQKSEQEALDKLLSPEVIDEFINSSNIHNSSKVVKGVVSSIDRSKGIVFVDVGLKSEGMINIREFFADNEKDSLQVGSQVDVYVAKVDSKSGGTLLSRAMAIREVAWDAIKKAFNNGETIEGIAFSRVKGGLSVDINGVIAFLPGSQIDVRPVKDVSNIIGKKIVYKVINCDEKNRSVILSRKELLELEKADERGKFLDTIAEGSIITGVVKNITNYGAFVDLGNVDGLLHVTDIKWEKITHPSEVIEVGQTVSVKVIKYDKEKHRLSLGMKQLTDNPWDKIRDKYSVGSVVKGKVSNLTKYGVFVQLEDGIEGLLHLSEISWSKDIYKKFKEFKLDQEVETCIIEIDIDKHRIALSLKKMHENPWGKFAEHHNTGQIIEGVIRNITDFGIFVGVEGYEIDGLVHISDLSWSGDVATQMSKYKKDDPIKVVYLGSDLEDQRIRLGVKQLNEDPFDKYQDLLSKDKTISCKVTDIKPSGIEVEVLESIRSFIKKPNLSRDRTDQRADRFVVGDKVDAKVVTFDKDTRRLVLSIKAYEEDEKNRAINKYSSESGVGVSSALGDAIQIAIEKAKKTDN